MIKKNYRESTCARALGGWGEKRILGASQGSLRIFVSEAKQKAQ